MSEIIQNAIYIIESDTFLVSCDRHDFQSYKMEDGTEVFIDGGHDYFRTGNIDHTNVHPFFLTTGSSVTDVIEKLLWGTYGKDCEQPFKWVRLIDCESEHLNNILKNVKVDLIRQRTIHAILEEREEK